MMHDYWLIMKIVFLMQVYPVFDGNSVDSVHSDSSMKEDAQSSYSYSNGRGYVTLYSVYQLLVFSILLLHSITSLCILYFNLICANH